MSQEEMTPRRCALGDVTNQIVGKRGFSLVSDDTRFHSAKKECVGLDNNYFTKQTFRKDQSVLRPHSCNKINSLSETTKEHFLLGVPENAKDFVGVKDGEVVRDSCVPIIGMSDADGGGRVVVDVEDDEKTESVVVLENVSKGKGGSSLGVNDEDNDVSVGNLESSKDEYLDVSRFPESQESICGLERCIGQKGGDGFPSMSVDLIKSCLCSFCTKAAYLWSDLHYQDMKGRIAAVKKSQKEASILVHQNSRDVGQGNVGNYSSLESDLTGRWKSLFVHMEDIFVRESIQLETNLSTLKEVRDDCKTDLET